MSMPRPRPQSAAPEVTIASVRRHARRLALPALILVVAVGSGSYFTGRAAPYWGGVWFGPTILGLGVLIFALAWLAWLARRYVVTTRRLIVQRGVLVRHRQEILHTRGYGCELVQSPLQRVFGSGDVRVNVGLDHPILVKDVPHAKVFTRALQDLQEASDSWAIAQGQQNTAAQGTFTEL